MNDLNRADGDYDLYWVECLWPYKEHRKPDNAAPKLKREESWHSCVGDNVASFDWGQKLWPRYGEMNKKHPAYPFTASGECWQKTCCHAVFDLRLAQRAFNALVLHNPGESFRLVRRRVTRYTEVIGFACNPAGKPERKAS
jgi:hypothetical protein